MDRFNDWYNAINAEHRQKFMETFNDWHNAINAEQR